MCLFGKRILLGVGGGIAVYRAVELMRLLMKQGAEVQVVMTKAAQAFVTPLTFEALSGNKVHTDLFDLTQEHGMGHIQLVRWADVVVIAPATANLLSKLAYGIAEDLLTTAVLACEQPVLVAPAMNVSMWETASNQNNMQNLAAKGFHFIAPNSGILACGEEGAGRLAEPDTIMQALLPLLTEQTLAGQQWVINAGPTVESWDDVRTLSNRATGSLGALLADEVLVRGAGVTLIAGPGTQRSMKGVVRVDVESALEMLKTCEHYAAGVDIFVATAAVSDYRFAAPMDGKLKRKNLDGVHVSLVSNPDIVASIARLKNRPKHVIAFAAEAENHLAFAKSKLESKAVDAVVANDVSNMGSKNASGWWVSKGDAQQIPEQSKEQFVKVLVEHILELQGEL